MAKHEYSRVPLVLFAIVVVGAGGWFGDVWLVISSWRICRNHEQPVAMRISQSQKCEHRERLQRQQAMAKQSHNL